MLTRIQSRLAAAITAAALGIATVGFGAASAKPMFDPGMNFAYITVPLGDSVDDQTFRMPLGNMDARSIKLVGVDGPAGMSVNLDSYSVEDNDKLELTLTVKQDFLKGTGAGAYPVALTLLDASGAKCVIFVTVNVQ